MRTPLQKGESVLLVTYSSGIILIGPALVLAIGAVAAYFIGFTEHWGWIAALLGLLYFMGKYFEWRANIWVVTTWRVIDESGFISHFAKESPLDKINNVSYDQTLWGRIFNFGHVEIQTAAELGATDYFRVNHPKRLKDTITAAQSEFRNVQTNRQAIQMAQAIGNLPANSHPPAGMSTELEKLYELKQKGILSEEEYQRAKNKLLGN
jgi:uncharacterized membrane protein YdbT with pleckstrin-like domain